MSKKSTLPSVSPNVLTMSGPTIARRVTAEWHEPLSTIAPPRSTFSSNRAGVSRGISPSGSWPTSFGSNGQCFVASMLRYIEKSQMPCGSPQWPHSTRPAPACLPRHCARNFFQSLSLPVIHRRSRASSRPSEPRSLVSSRCMHSSSTTEIASNLRAGRSLPCSARSRSTSLRASAPVAPVINPNAQSTKGSSSKRVRIGISRRGRLASIEPGSSTSASSAGFLSSSSTSSCFQSPSQSASSALWPFTSACAAFSYSLCSSFDSSTTR